MIYSFREWGGGGGGGGVRGEKERVICSAGNSIRVSNLVFYAQLCYSTCGNIRLSTFFSSAFPRQSFHICGRSLTSFCVWFRFTPHIN